MPIFNLKTSLIYLLLLKLVFLSSCQKEESLFTVTDKEPGNFYIDPSFLPYLENFIIEANIRGLNIEKIDLPMVFDENINPEYAAVCSNGSIRVRPSIWNLYDECLKEWLIFHELGHCYLNRDHNNNITNSRWISLMQGEGDGFPNPLIKNIEFYEPYRSYYIDELFDSETPLPNWFSEDLDLDILNLSDDLIYSNIAIDYSEILIDIGPDSTRIDIFLDSILVHEPITITESGFVFINSLTISDGNIDVNMDLKFGAISVSTLCKNINIDTDNIGKISIVNIEESTQFFINEDHVLTMSALNSNIRINTKLESGIKGIDVYKL